MGIKYSILIHGDTAEISIGNGYVAVEGDYTLQINEDMTNNRQYQRIRIPMWLANAIRRAITEHKNDTESE